MSVALESRVLFSAADAASGPFAASTQIAAGVLGACRHLEPAFLCGVVGVGELRVNVPSGTHVEATEPWIVSFGARAGGDYRFSDHFVMRAYLEVDSMVGRPTLSYNEEELWRAPPVAGVAGLGLLFVLDASSVRGRSPPAVASSAP